ncbi:uncharacterized protein DUF2771 [Pseudonocardia sediminis]|uniref:Uncharacterized protein DUF2771 n=1 Tax=Pseudonocardia sediminis TaxID=1397368 RepID=A0A4Q7V766_PSEST|nr:DUF2771 family protein [Pseudonocardia sediminis]RZT88579.1 uncharacterized protein DUF2771 [Pseudonocardia sediminis]
MRVNRPTLAGLAAAAALVLAGCGTSAPPTVTFDIGGNTLTAAPTQYCDNQLQNCADDANARLTAPVEPGTPVTITVPEEVSSAPWQVAFAYLGPDGRTRTDGRSPIATPGQRTEYTLTLPDPRDRLVTAQVQLFGPAPVADPASGQITFPVRATWVLVAP